LGEVPEWTIGAVSKTVVALRATVGSNPTLSAAVGKARLLLGRGYIISGNRFFLWVRVCPRFLICTIIFYGCTYTTFLIECQENVYLSNMGEKNAYLILKKGNLFVYLAISCF
jgi:hypothetical protein